MASELYKNIEVNSNNTPSNPTSTNRAYKGLSTVNPENVSKTLYDIGLIKQDLLNHFHIRQGEKLMNPEFGTIIWDAIFEPMTPSMEEAIAENVKRIVNSDPRVTANAVIIENGTPNITTAVCNAPRPPAAKSTAATTPKSIAHVTLESSGESPSISAPFFADSIEATNAPESEDVTK